MKPRAISATGLLILGIALPAAAQTASTSPPNPPGSDIPEACRAALGPDGHAMPNMQKSADMQASMAKMSDAQKADMQAMDKMHTPMMMGMKIKDPDVAYVCMMIPHHQGAIDMSRVVLEHGKDGETRKMAEGVIKAQEKEIADMKAWLTRRPASGVAPTGLDRVGGEVIKIDKSAGKITLKHGPIKKFDMDSMTMVFRVADPVMLDKVKEGDKIQFEADRVNGALTVVKIDAAK